MLRHLDTGEKLTDVLEAVMTEERPGDPWVMLNMVTSVDGATAISGGSTALSDDDDRALFHALRAVPDYILVGAGTVRAENYRPVKLSEEATEARVRQGRSRPPRLVIVSGRLRLDPTARVFSDPDNPVLVLGGADAEPKAASALREVCEVRLLDSLDGGSIVGQLDGVVLGEGGPTLNGDLVVSGSVDEINWTVSPFLVSGDSKRISVGLEKVQEMALRRSWLGDRALFLRYVRA